MMPEETARVRTSDGGAIAFAAGQKYSLKIEAGETATEWMDGSPITRAEFEAVLAPHGPFEIVPPSLDTGASADLSASAQSAAGDKSATASATADKSTRASTRADKSAIGPATAEGQGS
jgi:hypothetical protein